MTPVAIALILAPLAVLAAWSIVKSMLGGQVHDGIWTSHGEDHPLRFAVFLLGRIALVAIWGAEALHVFGLAGDPILFLREAALQLLSSDLPSQI
ncbi:MAG: hypothetical protein WDM92_10065 [Caulobacteraceae bacterium]